MHIVMVETTRPRGFDHVAELAAAGIEVSFLTQDLHGYRRTVGFERHKLAARIVEVEELSDTEQVAAQVRGRLGPHPPDGVLCFTDEHVLAAACLARDLGLRHEPVKTVRLLRDKPAVRARLGAAGIGTLHWHCVETAAEGLRAAEDIGYPVVVKPASGHGSVGVIVVWGRQQAARVLRTAFGEERRLLIEEYVVGRQVSAEMLVQDGLPVLFGFAERLPTPPGTTTELGGHFPARFEQRGACRRFALEAVRALEIRDSALHIEMMVTPTGPELVEVNSRIAGHVVPRQMSLSLGRSILLDLALHATGCPVPDVDEPVSVLALRQLCSITSGTVRETTVPSDLPGTVTDCHVSVQPSDHIVPTRHNFQRLGYVLAQGLTQQEAAATAEETLDRLHVRMEDGTCAVHADTSAIRDEQGEGQEPTCGPHVLLLLDSEGPKPIRILESVAAATGSLSVLWSGPAEPAIRDYWAQRYSGHWHHLQGPDHAAEALRHIQADHPVAAIVTFTPGLAALRDQLSAAVEGVVSKPAASGTAGEPGGGPPSAPGHVVVSVVADGALQHLDIVDDLGAGAEGHRTLHCPSALPEEAAAALRAATTDAVARAGITTGVVRCVFPADPAADRSDSSALRAGLDESTRAIYDAAHCRDVVATAIAAALGTLDRPPTRRAGVAVLRSLAAPAGPFRVLQATASADLYDHPELVHADALLTAGDVRQSAQDGPWLAYTVRATDAGGARAAAARIEAGLVFQHTALQRTHVLLIDRIGAATWTREDSTPLLPPERFRVSVLSADPSATTVAAAPTDVAVRTDVFDHDATAALAETLHRAHPVDRIASASERLLAPAAALRERWGLPGDTPFFARSMLDKAEMKRIARRAGIPHAAGKVVYEAADAHKLLEKYGAVVVKPRELSGSQGVQVCPDRRSLQAWLERTFVPGRFLVERRVIGSLCHIDAVVHEGVVAWDVSVYRRDTLAYTRGEPLSSQTVQDPVLRKRAGVLLDRVIAAWQVAAGVLHLEAFVEDDLVFCEVAARPGGAGVVAAFQATRGIDLRHAKILIDAGEDPRTLTDEPVAAHAGWTVHYSRGGRLTHYDDSAVADRAYHRDFGSQVGERIAPSAFSGTGLSTHVFADDSSAEISRLITAAEQDIRLRIEPSSATAQEGHQ